MVLCQANSGLYIQLPLAAWGSSFMAVAALTVARLNLWFPAFAVVLGWQWSSNWVAAKFETSEPQVLADTVRIGSYPVAFHRLLSRIFPPRHPIRVLTMAATGRDPTSSSNDFPRSAGPHIHRAALGWPRITRRSRALDFHQQATRLQNL